mmetsp:Transcript_7171/g.8236  ORF Transcript_7171/g.8236 Transcript_7171/m.8236 type:complete len:616 (-) Transcript_7171:77-1924(-)
MNQDQSSRNQIDPLGSSDSNFLAINSLLEISAKDLVTYLLKNRFNNDTSLCSKFVTECALSLPDGVVAEGLVDAKTSLPPPEILGEVLSSQVMKDGQVEETALESQVSCINPARFKSTLQCYTKGILFANPKGEHIFISGNMLAFNLIFVFPKPELCNQKSKGKKILPGRLILLPLKTSVAHPTIRNKELKQICFSLPTSESNEEKRWIESIQTSLSFEETEPSIVSVDYPSILKEKLKNGEFAEAHSNKYIFQSQSTAISSGQYKNPFAQCYFGINQGALFLLEEGLLFFKPPMFIHRSDLRSIGCGRGSSAGSGSTRYVDLAITLHGEDEESPKNIEFSNISREELRPIKDFIEGILTPAMRRDAVLSQEDAESSIDGAESIREEDNVASSSNSIGKNIESEGDTKGSSTRRRLVRKAAEEAREATQVQSIGKNEEENDTDDASFSDSDDETASFDSDEESSDDEEESLVSEGSSVKKRPRGRHEKTDHGEMSGPKSYSKLSQSPTKDVRFPKPRGRPKKIVAEVKRDCDMKVSKKRGRPKGISAKGRAQSGKSDKNGTKPDYMSSQANIKRPRNVEEDGNMTNGSSESENDEEDNSVTDDDFNDEDATTTSV